MLEPVRIVPQWKELKSQLKGKLQAEKGLPEETEGIMLSDRPTILFRESCSPSLMPPICFYSCGSTDYFASFTYRGRSKVRLWMYSAESENPIAQKYYAMEEDPKVLLITHVPSRNLLVAYCNDIHLRVFGDHMQDFQLLSDKISPYSITSMCYNQEMCELVTGAIGILAFWSFGTDEDPSLSVTLSASISSGEFVHFLSVERERRVLVALCENVILVFDYQSKVKIRALQVSQGVSLTCCAAYWPLSFLYAGDLAGDVKVWNFNTGIQTNQFKAHLSAIVSVVSRFSVHTLVTASLDGLLKEWDLSTCELLRRVDIGEPVFQMQFISKQTFFLRTLYTFSIRTINNFYQLFNRPNSILKNLVRIECGPDKARILAATEDGVIRFLSPVTGEMLFVTWPFQLIEKALDYVFDPDQEELLVTMGTTDIYVLDATKNPCPCKYILRTTESMDDKVLCLTYSRLDLAGRTFSFIFSGYKSGRVRSVTQHLYRMGSRRIHDGNVVALSTISASGNLSYHSRESSYLCSYGSDEYIILSDVILKKNSLLEVEPLVCIPSFHCRINHLLLIPGYICVLTEQNRVQLWRQASLIPGKKNPFWKETNTMHSASITSFDYCHTLRMLVTGGSDGSIRLWDILGQMLVEFDTSLRFSRVCFANQRGDLVVGCNKNIYFISCVNYLPKWHLSKLAAQHVRDDVIERPLPFLPHFLLRFDIVFVPKYYQVGKHAKKYERLEPITNHKEVVIEKSLVKVEQCAGLDASALPPPDFYGVPPAVKEALPGVGLKYQPLPHLTSRKPSDRQSISTDHPLLLPYRQLPPLRQSIPLLRRMPFGTGHSWPIAPDGYIPNSVIRAQLFPKGSPAVLQCALLMSKFSAPRRRAFRVRLSEDRKPELALAEKVRKKKGPRKRRVSTTPEGQRRRDLLADIVSKPWLRHKPSEITVPAVTRAILELMDDVPFSTYLMCTAALVQIAESYQLPLETQEQAFERLMQDTVHKEVRMRVAAWEALGKMDLLQNRDIVPLAKALMDDHPRVRDLARSLLDSVAGITDKFALKKEMRRLAKTSLEDLKEIPPTDQKSFPQRLHAAGIIAESQGDAVRALLDVSQKLVFRVEKQLTANLFLMTDRSPEESPEPEPPMSTGRRRMVSAVQAIEEVVEEPEPEAQVEAKARWLGLFNGASATKPPSAIAIEAAKRQQMQKVPKVPSVLKERASEAFLSRDLLSESGSSTSGSTSGSSGSSMWRDVRKQKKQLAEKGQKLLTTTPLPGPKPPSSPPQEAQKPAKQPKQPQLIPLQRCDTRTQLYSEMLKRQHIKKEQAPAPSPAPKKESTAPPEKAIQPAPPAMPQEAPRGDLIDPNREYSSDKSKWRNDLYKLLMLRITPFVEGRTASEDLLASARMALGGRAMSWELFATVSQSLLSSQAKITPEPAKMKKCMTELFKSSPWELWPEQAEEGKESKETVVAVKMGRKIRADHESVSEGSSLEGIPGVKEEEEEEEAEAESVKSGKASVEKKLKAETQGKWKKTATSMVLRKKMTREEKKEAREEKKEAREEKEEAREEGRGEDQEEVKEVGAVERKEQELIMGKEGELDREKEQAKEKERELAKAKARAAIKQRWQGAVDRKEKEAAQRRAAVRKSERRGTKMGELAEESEAGDSEAERIQVDAAESVVSEVSEWPLVIAQDSSMVEELRERILAEAEEIALAELRELALAEAEERTLAEMREVALAKARKNILAELREKALAEARERMLTEMKQSSLAEARERVMSEVMERALAEAEEMALAEGIEEELFEERVKELAEERMRELAEERMRELTIAWSMEIDMARIEELAEARVAEEPEAKFTEEDEARIREQAEAMIREQAEAMIREQAKARIGEQAEARIREQAEAKIAELAEAMEEEVAKMKTAELAEMKAAELAEERIWKLAETKLKELAKARAVKMAVAKMRILAKGEAAQRDDRSKGEEVEISEGEEVEVSEGEEVEISEGEEAEMWEDARESELIIFNKDEREALMATLLEQRASQRELTCSDQALLLLDILTKPEGLGGSDSKVFRRLFKVVSLLKIPSGLQYKELAEYLLQKAEQVAKEGEEEDESLARVVCPIYEELRKAVAAHQPQRTNPREFTARLQALRTAAQIMVRARILKEQLETGFKQREWWAKADKEWLADEGRVIPKKAWVDERLKEAVRKWQAQQDRVEYEREQRHKPQYFPFKLRPVRLSEGEWEGRAERRKEKQVEEGIPERAEQPPGQAQPKRITWSLGKWQHRAPEAIFKLEEPPPGAEALGPAPRPKTQRLPKGSLYLPTSLPQIRRRQIRRRGAKQHILRPLEKTVDWDMFSMFYQSLMMLKEEGGFESAAWRELLRTLLDRFGLTNRLLRALLQQLLMGAGSPRKAPLPGKDLPVSQAEANLGERILYRVVHRSARALPKPPALHGVIPLSYRNNVHTLRLTGIAHFGTLYLLWKTFFPKGQLPKFCLRVQTEHHSK